MTTKTAALWAFALGSITVDGAAPPLLIPPLRPTAAATLRPAREAAV